MGRAFQNRKDSIAKTATQKSRVYSKYGREIYVVAKQGGADPDSNLALRSLIERAKKDQVPAHVISKAVDKAQGGGGEDYVLARYEGFGPGNCMVIVECLTDNNNRTYTDVRNCFTKTKSNLGAQGSVSHMFDHCAIFSFPGEDQDAVLELLMDADIDVTDVEQEDDTITVFAPQNEYAKTRSALLSTYPDIEFATDEIQWVPQTTIEVTGDDVPMLEKLLDMLDDVDDVQKVYHNAEY